MAKVEYFDKFGDKIKEGDTIRHEDGDEEMIYKGADDELGLNASNPDFKGNAGMVHEIYPLHQFDLTEWEIIK